MVKRVLISFFFQYYVQIHSSVASCVSKFLERQIRFLILTPFLVSQINIRKRVFKFEAKLPNLFCFYEQHFNSVPEE